MDFWEFRACKMIQDNQSHVMRPCLKNKEQKTNNKNIRFDLQLRNRFPEPQRSPGGEEESLVTSAAFRTIFNNNTKATEIDHICKMSLSQFFFLRKGFFYYSAYSYFWRTGDTERSQLPRKQGLVFTLKSLWQWSSCPHSSYYHLQSAQLINPQLMGVLTAFTDKKQPDYIH